MKTTICMILTLLSLGSWAQEEPFVRGWYLGAEVGGAESEHNEEETMIGLFAGYRFTRYFFLEGGYMDLGTYSIRRNDVVIADADVNAFKYMAGFSVPFAKKYRFQGKIGGIYSERDEVVSGTTIARKESNSSIGAEIGLRYHITKQTALHLDWGGYSVELWDFDFALWGPVTENVDAISTLKLGVSHKF